LKEIIRITGLEELTNRVGHGLNMLITENGKNISGGQRQRIVIARALYKDADVILLDEPFNELDRVAENALLAHFAQLAQSGKIVILITHNKESLSFCNKLIPLNDN
jgi:ABC-type bacteriocin/lantibiotic exporter with double-glycine peptidase domain